MMCHVVGLAAVGRRIDVKRPTSKSGGSGFLARAADTHALGLRSPSSGGSSSSGAAAPVRHETYANANAVLHFMLQQLYLNCMVRACAMRCWLSAILAVALKSLFSPQQCVGRLRQ